MHRKGVGTVWAIASPGKPGREQPVAACCEPAVGIRVRGRHPSQVQASKSGAGMCVRRRLRQLHCRDQVLDHVARLSLADPAALSDCPLAVTGAGCLSVGDRLLHRAECGRHGGSLGAAWGQRAVAWERRWRVLGWHRGGVHTSALVSAGTTWGHTQITPYLYQIHLLFLFDFLTIFLLTCGVSYGIKICPQCLIFSPFSGALVPKCVHEVIAYINPYLYESINEIEAKL